MEFSSEDSRWQAVRLRLSSAHTSFVYAVKTTGIFCRPTCPARLARRSNVAFFDAAAAAESAGYRACKRCKPDSQDLPTPKHRQRKLVEQACEIIRQQDGNAIPADVARCFGLSLRYFHGIFKEHLGLTPTQYARQCSQVEHGCTNPTKETDLFHNVAGGGLAREQPTTISSLPNLEYSVPETVLSGLRLPELATDWMSIGEVATEALTSPITNQPSSIDPLAVMCQAKGSNIGLLGASMELEETVLSQEWMSLCWLNPADEECMRL